MPICARCLGAHGGILAALGLLFFGCTPPWWLSLPLCLPLVADWSLQRWARVESTGPRRLATGWVGGLGYGLMFWQVLCLAVQACSLGVQPQDRRRLLESRAPHGPVSVRSMKRTAVACSFALLVSGAARAVPQDAAPEDAGWTRWRGPLGTGVAPGANPPVEWSEEENIRWKVAIPGLGASSPIVWRNRIYLTTAVKTEKTGAEERPAQPRRGGGFMNRARPTKIHQFLVLAFDRRNGAVVWRTEVKEAVPHEAGHQTATQASNSPLTDGEHIYAYFGSRGLYCLDAQGKIKWSKTFGLMRTAMGFGEGSSPALYGNTLVVNWDQEGDSFVVALDKRNGEELWRKARDERTTWATPLVAEVDGRPQIVIPAPKLSRGYDLESGEQIWACGGMTANCIPSPVFGDGIVYLMSGFRGSSMQAIRLSGATGDIDFSDSYVWDHRRGTSYVPSALLYDGYLYFLRLNNGVLSCLDAKTGNVHYEGQRMAGMRTIYASPVGAAGRVYLTSRSGTTKVIKLGPEYEELATNELDDEFDASAAIVGDELFLRGRNNLYCIARQ